MNLTIKTPEFITDLMKIWCFNIKYRNKTLLHNLVFFTK